jgi:hypothetical protein
MKKHIFYGGAILAGSLLISAALLIARFPTGNQGDNSAQLKELRARVGQLETKAAALQKELDQVHKSTPNVVYLKANQPDSPAPTVPAPEQIPTGWKPFEFNGMTYYFTPLGNGIQHSAPAPTQVQILADEAVAAK